MSFYNPSRKPAYAASKPPSLMALHNLSRDHQNQTESPRMHHQNPHHWWHYVLIPWLSRQKACVCTIKTPIIDGITYSSHDYQTDRKLAYAPSKPPSLMALCTLPMTFYKPDRKLAYAFSKPPSLMALRTFPGYILNQTESAYVFSNPITKSKWPYCVLHFKTFIWILILDYFWISVIIIVYILLIPLQDVEAHFVIINMFNLVHFSFKLWILQF